MRYRANPNVVVTTLDDDESVLLDLKSRRYYSLNETGTWIWERLANGAAVSEIVENLTAEYDVTGEEARQHVDSLIKELKSEGLIKEASA